MDTHKKKKSNTDLWMNVLCVVSYVATILCTAYIIIYLFNMQSNGGLSTEKFIGFMVLLLVFFLVILLSNNRKQDVNKHLKEE